MGVNYYWNPGIVTQIYNLDSLDTDDPKVHIGKLSAAGRYCPPCGITAHGHSAYVNGGPYSDGSIENIVSIKSDTCPNCNSPWKQVNSFTFTMMGHLVTLSNLYNLSVAQRNANASIPPVKVVVDEYGEEYDVFEFLDGILRKCPLQYQHYGRWS